VYHSPSKTRYDDAYRFNRSRTLNGRLGKDHHYDNSYPTSQRKAMNFPDYTGYRRSGSREKYNDYRSRSASPHESPMRQKDFKYDDRHARGFPARHEVVLIPRRRPASRETFDDYRHRLQRTPSRDRCSTRTFDRNNFNRYPAHFSPDRRYGYGDYNRYYQPSQRDRSASGDRVSQNFGVSGRRQSPGYLYRHHSASPNRMQYRNLDMRDTPRYRRSSIQHRYPTIPRTGSWPNLNDFDPYMRNFAQEHQTREWIPDDYPSWNQETHRRSESLPPRYQLRFDDNSIEDRRREPKFRARKSYEGAHFGTQFESDRMPPPIPPFSGFSSTRSMNQIGEKKLSHSREAAVRGSYDFMRRRYYDKSSESLENSLHCGVEGDSSGDLNIFEGVLKVDAIDFQAMENSKAHRTFEYELAKDVHQPTPVFRRGQTFIMNINFKQRKFDADNDLLFLNFYIGPNPTVPKHTRVVLPVTPGVEFQRVPHQWDARVTGQEGNNMTIEVHVPVTSPVGIWHSVLETTTKKTPSYRLQYRCVEDMYIIFNPFDRDDPVFMDNDEQRYEYVISDCGKIFTGAYHHVTGRPWIFGQFDQCVLPATCILLEMSGLSHAERANPLKVTRALTSMIRASRSSDRPQSWMDYNNCGLIEAQVDDSTDNGSSPHLWTGSVQIIEEFLRNGTAPVRYGQCWVMAALMTSMCRALGLPARPTTAFVYAQDSHDSLTVDRYVNRYGELMEHGPNRDQRNAIWSFHTWCDVWMSRPDLPREYSGWQVADPFQASRTCTEGTSSSVGPCPIEALRRGDIGLKNDVDSFYASLNSYVRYFYEDDASGWGFSPFEQFRYPVSRCILTKAVGCFDNAGDDDWDDVTNFYIDTASSDAERFAIFNSSRGVSRETPSFEYKVLLSPLDIKKE